MPTPYQPLWLDPLFGRGFPADMVEVYGVELPEQSGDAESIATPTHFVGLNCYFRQIVKADESVPVLGLSQVPGPNVTHTMLDWEVHPAGLEELILRLAKEYGAEMIYITENGSAWVDQRVEDFNVDDTDRTAYLDGHLAACVRTAGRLLRLVADGQLRWAYGYAPASACPTSTTRPTDPVEDP